MNVENCSDESFILNETDAVGNDSTGELFRTPFQEPFPKLIFIICFATVFAACVIGKYSFLYIRLNIYCKLSWSGGFDE